MTALNTTINIVFRLSVLIFLLTGCASSESSENESTDSSSNYRSTLISEAQQRFGDDYELIYSPGKNYVICRKLYKGERPGAQLLDYFVYDKEEDAIIFEDKVPSGIISWLNETVIRVEEIRGTEQIDRNNPPLGYKYNVSKMQKIKF